MNDILKDVNNYIKRLERENSRLVRDLCEVKKTSPALILGLKNQNKKLLEDIEEYKGIVIDYKKQIKRLENKILKENEKAEIKKIKKKTKNKAKHNIKYKYDEYCANIEYCKEHEIQQCERCRESNEYIIAK